MPSFSNCARAATIASSTSPRWMKTRISPDVFASAAAIALTMRSCSQSLNKIFRAHRYQLEPAPPPTETPSAAAKPAEATAAAGAASA